MKRNSIPWLKKGLILTAVALTWATCSLPATVACDAQAQAAASADAIAPHADILEWRVKIENGKLYKRLYNTSTMEWVGDWIYVCDYPG